MLLPTDTCELDQVVEKLASLAVARRQVRALVPSAEKQAAPDLSSAWEWLKTQGGKGLAAAQNYGGKGLEALQQSYHDNPYLTAGLGGAALGGLYGGLTSFGRPREERQPLHGALSGALAGAGLGLGGALLHQHLGPLAAPTPAAPPSANAGPPIEFEHGGRRYQLPADLPNAPEISARLTELQHENPALTASRHIGDFANNYAKEHPILAGIGALDATRFATGTAAELTNPGGSLNPSHLRAGIEKTLTDPAVAARVGVPGGDKAIERQLLARWQRETPQAQQRILAKLRMGGPERQFARNLVHEGTPFGGRGFFSSVGELRDTLMSPFSGLRAKLPNAVSRRLPQPRTPNPLAFTGFRPSEFANPPVTPPVASLPGPPGSIQPLRLWQRAARNLQRIPAIPGGWKTQLGARLGGRLALYGGIPLLERYLSERSDLASRRAEIESLLQRYAVPIGRQ